MAVSLNIPFIQKCMHYFYSNFLGKFLHGLSSNAYFLSRTRFWALWTIYYLIVYNLGTSNFKLTFSILRLLITLVYDGHSTSVKQLKSHRKIKYIKLTYCTNLVGEGLLVRLPNEKIFELSDRLLMLSRSYACACEM